MAIVAVMAILAVAVVMFAAVANGYEPGYNPVKKPVSVEKKLEPGTESSGDMLFDFELIVSPQYIGDKDNQIDDEDGTHSVTSVTGIVYDVTYDDDKVSLAPVKKASYTIKNHTVKFSLKAGQRIVFEDMPFAHDDKDCGFIVNELIDPDSEAAKAGYVCVSGAPIQKAAEYKPTDAAYTSKMTKTGTFAKAAFDKSIEYVCDEDGNHVYTYYDDKGNVIKDPECGKDDYGYIDAYFDVDNNRIDNPNCDPNDYYDRIYFNNNTDPTTANWIFDIYQNGEWVYYNSDGNVVNDPTDDSETNRGGGYVVDGKFVAFVKQIKAYHDKDGKETTPDWASYEEAYVTQAAEVVFSNKKAFNPRPLKITKKLADGAKDSTTGFKFELIVSPEHGEDVSYKGRKVSGKFVDAYGSTTTSDYTFGEDHAITFELHAGESIEFADMPFATDDEKGTYIIKELSYETKEGTEEQPAASYKFGTVSADKGTCTVTKDGDAHHDSSALGTATGTLGANGLTSVTVTNRQVTPPSQETPVDGNAKVTISKMLEGADDPDATFDFEMILSPEWATPEYYIGTNTESVSITGTVYNKSDGKEIGSKTYNVVQNRVTGIELKAGQYITFADVPYKHVEGEPGAVIVNELLEGVVAKSYSLQGYMVDTGKDLGFGQATQDTIANTDNTPVSSLLAPSGATDKTATGVYGELVLDGSGNGEFGVTFTNAPAGSKLTVTKNLEGFDFGKYDEANVAFNVYRFDTEADCVAFVRNGNAQNATWKGTLAMHLTANGVQSTELTGLDEGYYAIEELSATNMKVVDIARKHVHVTAGAGGEFTVNFNNTFDDQNTYENAIVNSYKKVIDKDGKITWQRYKDGEPVTD